MYGAPIYCALNVPKEKARQMFEREISPKVVSISWGKAHSFAYSEDDNIVYGIWIDDIKNVGHLAHEVFHLVGFILNDRGVKYDPDNDEPFAYLIEHLIKVFIKKGTHVRRT